MTSEEWNRREARNLMETLGCQRAIHAANQYGWYEVAVEIAKHLDAESVKPAAEQPSRKADVRLNAA